MKEIVIISGKGGTGKTSLAASLAALAEMPVIADCDVDAADMHLVLDPQIKSSEEFTGGKSAAIIPEKCNSCGKCENLCRFGAIVGSEDDYRRYSINRIACEGCGVCSYFCPEKAIEFKPAVNGRWFVSDTRYGPMVHARLGIAEENSGKLVTLVKNQARAIAGSENRPYIIVDGPPGIGCPVLASITGADVVLIVTEPTVAGDHDLERVAELAAHFRIPTYICMNKYDLNPGMSKLIEDKATTRGLKFIGHIRYDRSVTEAQVKKVPVVALKGTPAADDIINTWEELLKELEKQNL